MPKDLSEKLMNGPIPGENYTADTKNFPWHRPPQFTNTDDAIEYSVRYILDEERSDSYVTMIDVGWSVVDIAQMFVMDGVGKGLWTLDFGLLIAGPIAHLLVIMCRGDDVDFDLGIENPEKSPSAEYFKARARLNPDIVDALGKVLNPIDEDATPESASLDREGNPNDPAQAAAGGEPTPPEDVATQPPSTGLGGMAPQNPSAGAPNDPTQGVM